MMDENQQKRCLILADYVEAANKGGKLGEEYTDLELVILVAGDSKAIRDDIKRMQAAGEWPSDKQVKDAGI